MTVKAPVTRRRPGVTLKVCAEINVKRAVALIWAHTSADG